MRGLIKGHTCSVRPAQCLARPGSAARGNHGALFCCFILLHAFLLGALSVWKHFGGPHLHVGKLSPRQGGLSQGHAGKQKGSSLCFSSVAPGPLPGVWTSRSSHLWTEAIWALSGPPAWGSLDVHVPIWDPGSQQNWKWQGCGLWGKLCCFCPAALGGWPRMWSL